jgi:hypothetical protein
MSEPFSGSDGSSNHVKIRGANPSSKSNVVNILITVVYEVDAAGVTQYWWNVTPDHAYIDTSQSITSVRWVLNIAALGGDPGATVTELGIEDWTITLADPLLQPQVRLKEFGHGVWGWELQGNLGGLRQSVAYTIVINWRGNAPHKRISFDPELELGMDDDDSQAPSHD